MVILPAVFYALQRDLGLSLNDLATMILFQALSQAAAAPFWGVMADRGVMTRKKILIIGSVSQGAVTCIVAFANQLIPMIVLRALNGVLLASLRPVANGVLADVTSEARRGKVYGWIFFALNAGMVVGSLVATPLSTKQVFGMQGWRVAFLLIGGLSMLVGVLVGFLMVEPEREGAHLAEQGNASKGICSELRRLWGYCKMPTFLALVIQGCFGCVPWNAMSFRTLFFQVSGLSDFESSLLQALGQTAGAFGALFGGVLADFVTRRWLPLHGRPLIAQVSVLMGIPIAYLTFMVIPPPSGAFWYYLFLVCLLGFTASWCATGVNLPILSEIVPADNRSAIMAWQTALEGSCAAVLGNAMVGLLAQNVFGYDLASATQNPDSMANSENRAALGKALALTVSLPWILCLFFYTLLHWSYPRDLRRVKRLALDRAEKTFRADRTGQRLSSPSLAATASCVAQLQTACRGKGSTAAIHLTIQVERAHESCQILPGSHVLPPAESEGDNDGGKRA
ncbi:unnamed protein product [Polarella glacialis]|uniref:Major facilitator superfamily (MFS) profile domain-containing protein n=1 Tax=Polarella glacialis TaxID=89957 RepID=A0A813LH41_POLGL|nr:unnamed protein product [Polarella glacialis]